MLVFICFVSFWGKRANHLGERDAFAGRHAHGIVIPRYQAKCQRSRVGGRYCNAQSSTILIHSSCPRSPCQSCASKGYFLRVPLPSFQRYQPSLFAFRSTGGVSACALTITHGYQYIFTYLLTLKLLRPCPPSMKLPSCSRTRG
jgi:hypothetical protein